MLFSNMKLPKEVLFGVIILENATGVSTESSSQSCSGCLCPNDPGKVGINLFYTQLEVTSKIELVHRF